MKPLNFSLAPKLLPTLLVLVLFIFLACKSDQKKTEAPAEAEVEEVVDSFDGIEIVTNVMDFQTADTIASGWQTFKYINNSQEPHFVLFDKYPEGKTMEDTMKEVAPPFDKGMELINEGKMDEAMAAFGELPEWFGQIVFTGGSGLISPGQTNTFTLKLDPGLYIIECYVKMNEGRFHTSMGMAKQIIVTDEGSGRQPPEPTVNMSISSTDGLVISDSISKGTQTFKIDYKDQIVHENFVGHDVNLVKVDEGADLDALEAWMNWATPTGLMSPSPEGFTFIGGTNDAPGGTTQYFSADIAPGNYLFISEVPGPSSKGLLKSFTVVE